MTRLVLALALVPLAGASAAPMRCFGARSRDPERACVNHALDRVVTPTPLDAQLEPSEPCIPVRRARPEVCEFGVPRDRAVASVALIGDSHSTHWRAALDVAARAKGWHGYSINRSNCPYTYAQVPAKGQCGGWAMGARRWLRQHHDVSIVVTSANSGAHVIPAPGATWRQTKLGGYQRAWADLPATVQHVFVLRDVPHNGYRTNACVTHALSQGAKAGARCARARSGALRTDLEAEAAEQSTDPRVQLIDMTPFMCDDMQCFPVVGGALVIKDIGHLTRTFSATLGPFLRREMARRLAAS